MRRSLILLILAGIIPIVALGATFGAVTLRNQREAITDRGRTEANLAAALVAATVKSNVDAVRMVAQSPALDAASPDLGRFDLLTRRIVANQPDWHAVGLWDGDGRLLFSTRPGGNGNSIDFGIDADALRVARSTDEPQIGRIRDTREGVRSFPVIVAVRDANHLRYVVSVLIPADHLRPLLIADPLSPGWTAAIVTPSGVLATVAADGERTTSSEPRPVALTAPIEGTRWFVRITAPAKAFLAPVRRAVLLLVVAAAICLLLLILLARVLAADLRQVRIQEASELQRQRMEALGRLTGGVAHDFNNLLTPIMINLDLIGQRNTDERLTRNLEAAMAGAERARTLVARLLSFSRQQQLALEPVDVPEVLDGLTDLIEQSLTSTITMRFQIEPGLCAVMSDRSQLELAILNLAINARDAMPGGGQLIIASKPASPDRTEGLAAGSYIEIAVADTGSGMDAATLRNATDPFFTTKPVGKGTGLGLSMVHGFALQSGGVFLLNSEVDKGTTAVIILPCSDDPPPAAIDEPVATPASGLAILLVDDDERVRRASAEVLTDAGHSVSHAANVDDAMSFLEGGNVVDLMVTDLIMPGKSGAELVDTLRSKWPTVAVLMVTGHGDDVNLPKNVTVLPKPYRPASLLRAVEDALHRTR